MSNWTLDELALWDDKICSIARELKLDWFDINYETCDYHEMIGNLACHGMPSYYPHWSLGKTFERTHANYDAGLEGLPFELIVNTDSSIAYLMRENPLYLQILIMAHCVGHSDFFKNNRTFETTDPKNVVSFFRNARNRIQQYTEDVNIGVEAVEEMIDICHSIQYQIDRRGRKRLPERVLREKLIEEYNRDTKLHYLKKDILIERVPLEPEYDLLLFLSENCHHLKDWQRDIIEIIRYSSTYFMPQIRTKIINEGFASHTHYKILNMLNLDDNLYLPFIAMHNRVIRPWPGGLNPYHLGFTILTKIEEKYGYDEVLFARQIHSDESFIMQYLDDELIYDLNLFSYSPEAGSKKKNPDWTIKDVADTHESCTEIRKSIIRNIGGNSIPVIYVDAVKNGELHLVHEHDGRDLDLNYADNCVKNIKKIWQRDVRLYTIIEEESFEVS